MMRLSSSGVPCCGLGVGIDAEAAKHPFRGGVERVMNGLKMIMKMRIGGAIRRARPSACWIV